MSSRILRSPDGYVSVDAEAAIAGCYNVVASLADLPAPVAGVRTLPAGVTLICGAITLPAGERIAVPEDAVLLGRDAERDGILGDVDAPLIDAATNGMIINNLFLRNPNAGADAYCIRTTSQPFPNERISRIGGTAVSLGGTRGILIENAQTVDICCVLNRCTEAGIAFSGTNFAISVAGYTHIPDNPLTSTGILFHDGSVTSAFRCINAVFVLFDPGSTTVELDAGAALNLAAFYSNSFIDTMGGTANGLVNIGPDLTRETIFYANYGVADSRNGGGMSFAENPGSVNTVIPAVDTWVRIGAGNPGTHIAFTLDPSSARVQLEQPAGAETAVLRYNGVSATAAALRCTLSLRANDTAVARALAVRLILLPVGGGPAVPISPTFTTVTTPGVAFGSSLTLLANQALAPGDGIAVEVQNRTDGDNIVVDSIEVGFDGT